VISKQVMSHESLKKWSYFMFPRALFLQAWLVIVGLNFAIKITVIVGLDQQ